MVPCETCRRRRAQHVPYVVGLQAERAKMHRGPMAAAEAAKLLRRRSQAAVWVGGRRWNIRLAGDIDVRLPEKNANSAWTRLAEYERVHRVLERDVQVLDLRLPDRLIVRKAPNGMPRAKNKGRET